MAFLVSDSKIDLPVSRQLTIGNLDIDAYYDRIKDEYFFSGYQLSKAFKKGKNYVPDFFRSKQANSLYSKALVVPEKSISVKVVDSNGNENIVTKVTVSMFCNLLTSLVRKGNELAEILAFLLLSESITRRCDKLFKIQRTEQDYKCKEQQIFKALNKRCDCDLNDYADPADLFTSTELAQYLGLEVNRSNCHKFAAFMLKCFPGSDRNMGRRLYDINDIEVVRLAKRYFEIEAMAEIAFRKEINPNAFDDEPVENFADM